MSAHHALPALMAPIALGPVELRNRVVSTSHQTSLVHDHLPTDDLVAYHEARARGGAGAIFIEATATDPTGLLTAHTIGGFLPEVVPAYRRLADAVHAHGTRVLVQFNHGGREQISASPRAPTAAPSAIPSLRFKTEPRALTQREITTLIEGYAISTEHAAQGGLDGVELSISHGYLPAQFLSRQCNRRGDDWDGSLTARLRFSAEVLAAMRDAVGDRPMAVGARLSAHELTPGGMITRTASRPSPSCTARACWTSSRSSSATRPSPPRRHGSPLPRRSPPTRSRCRRPPCRAAVPPELPVLATPAWSISPPPSSSSATAPPTSSA